MIFQKESIEAILAERKTMTRRLVKETEAIITISEIQEDGSEIIEGTRVYSKDRVKWQVGRKYAVCPGRGKPQIKYCPKCKRIAESISKSCAILKGHCTKDKMDMHLVVPLFVEVTGIRKEKLHDISKEDITKEGFNDLSDFLIKFYSINKIMVLMKKVELKKREIIYKGEFENPDVWVISFKVVE